MENLKNNAYHVMKGTRVLDLMRTVVENGIVKHDVVMVKLHLKGGMMNSRTKMTTMKMGTTDVSEESGVEMFDFDRWYEGVGVGYG